MSRTRNNGECVQRSAEVAQLVLSSNLDATKAQIGSQTDMGVHVGGEEELRIDRIRRAPIIADANCMGHPCWTVGTNGKWGHVGPLWSSASSKFRAKLLASSRLFASVMTAFIIVNYLP